MKSIDGILNGTLTVSQASIIQTQQIQQLSSSRGRDGKADCDDDKDGTRDSKGSQSKDIASSSSISASNGTLMAAGTKMTSTNASMELTALPDHDSSGATLRNTNSSSFPSIINLSSITKIRKHLIDLQDNKGRTPLYISAAFGFKGRYMYTYIYKYTHAYIYTVHTISSSVELVAGFIRHHADITKQDLSGLSPILVTKKEIKSLMQKVIYVHVGLSM